MAGFDASQERHRTAIHEAGHALLACIYKLPIDYVTMEPPSGVNEEYKPRGCIVFNVRKLSLVLKDPVAIDQLLVTLCASHVAENEVFGGEPDVVGFVHDAEQINYLLNGVVIEGMGREEYQRDLFGRARAAVQGNRATLERIANELLLRIKLTEPEIAELVAKGGQ